MSSDSRKPDFAGANPATGTSLNPKFLLTIFRLWWYYAIPAGLLLAAAGAAAVWAVWVPEFEAKASIIISETADFIYQSDRRNDQSFAKKQKGVITSRMVLGPVVSKAEISKMEILQNKREDPVDTLAKMIRVRHDGGDMYLITCQAPNAQNATQIVNAVVDSYIRQVEHFDESRSTLLIKQLSVEINSQEEQVKRMKKNVTDRARVIAKVNPRAANNEQSTGSFDLHPIEQLRQQIGDLEVESKVLSSQIKAIQARPVQKLGEIDLKDQPEMAALMAEAQDLKDRIARREQIIRNPDDSQILSDKNKLSLLETSITKREEELQKSLAESYEAAAEAARVTELGKLEVELTELDERRRLLEIQRTDAINEITAYSEDNVSLELAKQELTQATEVLYKLKERHLLVSIESGRPRQVIKDAYASVPSNSTEFAPIKMMGLVGLMGLVIPYGFCVLWEMQNRRVVDSREMMDPNLSPLIGEIAAFPMRRRQANGQMMQLYEDSVDNLRTYIGLRWRDEPSQVLVICSAASGEGKTTIASQLASSIARTNGKTLLIDGDMRLPDMHVLFETQTKFGLAEVLKGEATAEEAIEAWDDNLHILPAGILDTNPHELLSRNTFGEMLNWARNEYDYIVIDTPPILAAAEALMMARHADRTIVCAMRDVSRLDRVKASHHRLVSAGAKVGGFVFSGVSRQRYTYRYGTYHY